MKGVFYTGKAVSTDRFELAYAQAKNKAVSDLFFIYFHLVSNLAHFSTNLRISLISTKYGSISLSN